MQNHTPGGPAAQPRPFRERRANNEKRDIVEFGVAVGQRHLVCGVEYLQSREIDAHIIKRVLLASLTRRLSMQQGTRTLRWDGSDALAPALGEGSVSP